VPVDDEIEKAETHRQQIQERIKQLEEETHSLLEERDALRKIVDDVTAKYNAKVNDDVITLKNLNVIYLLFSIRCWKGRIPATCLPWRRRGNV
jgi:predicted nuclease with TOPRIM domain